MTPDEFRCWVTLMLHRKLAGSKGELALMLGRSGNFMAYAQKNGADKTTALACAALLAGLKPFALQLGPDEGGQFDEAV